MRMGLGLGFGQRRPGIGGGGSFRNPAQFRWNPATDHGSTGNVFVAQSGGSDANPGTSVSPKATIAGGLAILTAGQTLKIGAGTYRETVDLTGKGGTGVGAETKIEGWGTAKPVISAQDVLTGWVACTVADEPALSAAIWPNCYRVDVPLTNFIGSQPRTAWLHENGTPLAHAMARLPNPRNPVYQQETLEYLTADATITSGGLITGYQLASLTSTLTEAQIENCEVLFHAYPYLDYRTPVLNYDTGTSTINLTDTTQTYETNALKDNFALVNCLPKMEKGQWGYTISGGTVTLYVWPNSAANLTANMTYARRSRCVTFSVDSHIHFRGLVLEGAASGSTPSDRSYALVKLLPGTASNIAIRNVLLRNTFRAGRNYAPIFIDGVDDLIVEGCKVDTACGQFGMFISGGNRGTVRFNDVVGSENSPFRFYGTRKMAFSNCRARRSGLTSHANKFNFYQQCHEVLAHNIDVDSAKGYATWQEASRVHFVGCIIPSASDGRGIVDQNNTTDTPAVGLGVDGNSSILNCWSWGYPDNLASGNNAISLTDPDNLEVKYSVFNTVGHGVGGSLSEINALSHCVWTKGTALGAGAEQVITTTGATYVDAVNGNFTLTGGSPVRTAVTKSLTTEIAALKVMFPHLPAADWDYDLVGNLVNWSAPHMGALVDPDVTRDVPPVWMIDVSISGTPLVGQTLTAENGVWASSPYRTMSYQWLKNGANISGATSQTYVPVTGDIGATLGCRVTATNASGSDTRTATMGSAVAASFPLADPVLALAPVTNNVQSFATRQIETPVFTTSNKPLLVYFSFRGSVSAGTTATITIGTSGRAFGTGTTIPVLGPFRQASYQTIVHGIVAPGSGNVTIQLEAAITIAAYRVTVVELDGATGFVLGTNAPSSSATSIAPSITTSAADSIVMHYAHRANGTGEVISVAGGTILSEGDTGGSGGASSRLACSWEQVAVSGTSANATFSWTTATSVSSICVEVLS